MHYTKKKAYTYIIQISQQKKINLEFFIILVLLLIFGGS